MVCRRYWRSRCGVINRTAFVVVQSLSFSWLRKQTRISLSCFDALSRCVLLKHNNLTMNWILLGMSLEWRHICWLTVSDMMTRPTINKADWTVCVRRLSHSISTTSALLKRETHYWHRVTFVPIQQARITLTTPHTFSTQTLSRPNHTE